MFQYIISSPGYVSWLSIIADKYYDYVRKTLKFI